MFHLAANKLKLTDKAKRGCQEQTLQLICDKEEVVLKKDFPVLTNIWKKAGAYPNIKKAEKGFDEDKHFNLFV